MVSTRGDVEVQPQAEEMLGGVDPQRLLEDAERRVAGDVEREQAPGGLILRWWPSQTSTAASARSQISSYRNVGWKVREAGGSPAGRCAREISRAQGSVVGLPNSSWLK